LSAEADPGRRAIEIDGLTLSLVDGGEGPPVVYLHGALATLEEGLIGLYPVLGRRFRMIVFDRPGHGLSTSDWTTGSAWRQARLIHAAVAGIGVERPVIVGHSFGGAVATAYALQFAQDTAGVVALAPIALPEPRLEHALFGWRAWPGLGEAMSLGARRMDEALLPALWGGMFAPQVMTPAFSAGFPFARAASPADLRANGQEAAAMTTDLLRSLSAYWTCRVPVRVLHGERDVVVNPMHGRILAMQAPLGRFRSLPGLGHMAHHFAPDAVLAAIEEVLAA